VRAGKEIMLACGSREFRRLLEEAFDGSDASGQARGMESRMAAPERVMQMRVSSYAFSELKIRTKSDAKEAYE
jgi:hypothetical protein